MVIKGKTANWLVTIGIEVHAQINTKTKLFSSSATNHNSMPNTQTGFFDIASPGQLPVLNMEAVKKAVKTGFAIKGNINKNSSFDRKHYFYPDLPQGYQITQLYHPIVEGGYIEILDEQKNKKNIRINRIHIEQDAGKLIHDIYPDKSCVDLNRAGIPLMEIVSEADMTSPHEACEYVKNLQALLRAIETSNADMEKGNFRCDVNISVRKECETKLGTRCEIKNVNSVRSVARAIEFEANRHVQLLESGEKIIQQTRLFDATTETTHKMRNKEDEDDYRYFPDPDLMPINLTDEFLLEIKKTIPELPSEKIARYQTEYSLSYYDTCVLISEKSINDYFQQGVTYANDIKNFVNLLLTELLGRLKKLEIDLQQCNIPPQNLAELSNSIHNNTISSKIAKDVIDIMLETGKSADIIIKENNLIQVTDEKLIVEAILNILSKNPSQVAEFKSGKNKVIGFFIGLIMQETKGKANPSLVNKLLTEQLHKM